MTNDDVAEVLELMEDYLKADGKTGKAMAYSNAANSLRRAQHIPADPSQLDGVGNDIRETIVEYIERGEVTELAELREKYPYLEQLTAVDGVGPKTAARINDELGIETVDGLIERADELPEVYRIGEKTASNIERAARRVE